MAVTDELYSKIVQQTIKLKEAIPNKDTNELAEIKVYELTSNLELSKNNRDDLIFQVTMAVVNHFRD